MSLFGWRLPGSWRVHDYMVCLIADDAVAQERWASVGAATRRAVLGWARDGGVDKYQGRCEAIAGRLREGSALTDPPLGPCLPWPDFAAG